MISNLSYEKRVACFLFLSLCVIGGMVTWYVLSSREKIQGDTATVEVPDVPLDEWRNTLEDTSAS